MRQPRLVALALVLLAVAGGEATAQDVLPHARGTLGVSGKATRLVGAAVPMLGVSAVVEFPSGFAVGGGAWLQRGRRTIAATGTGPDLSLRTAYGGVVARTPATSLGPLRARADVLVGAGTARLSLPLVGTDIAVDNYLVVEPGIAFSLFTSGPIEAGLSAGYRLTAGVEDLPGLAGEDLDGPTLGATLSVSTH